MLHSRWLIDDFHCYPSQSGCQQLILNQTTVGSSHLFLYPLIRYQILILLIVIMTIAIINKNKSAGVTERILLSKRAIIICLICIIPLYFLAIISGQYLNNHFEYYWAPFAIGAFVTISIWSLVVSAHRSYINRFNEDKN